MSAVLANLAGLFDRTKKGEGELRACLGCGSPRVRVIACSALGAVAWCQTCGTAHVKEHGKPGHVALLPERAESGALSGGAAP